MSGINCYAYWLGMNLEIKVTKKLHTIFEVQF